MAQVYLGLGSNMGDKKLYLQLAIKLISEGVGSVVRSSAFRTSEPWGFNSDNEFLNAVVLVETDLLPMDLLEKTQEIERRLGRTEKSTTVYFDRPIDIDVLLYDNLILDELTLKIPHPLITERDFVLIPLLEIAPELVNPVSGLKYNTIILQG
jgi:2-amino-4-hydroxy-6-hydroxymethyldihydropteridine diphosphokinase